MCLILFANHAHPDYRLIVAANRDEHFSRPSAAAAFWPDAPAVLAGRDLDKGGTWLGVTRSGRFAALTNYRGAMPVAGGASRGILASGFLRGSESPAVFVAALAAEAGQFQGFSLLVADRDTVCYFSNRDDPTASVREVAPGVHGLSNHLLDTPWPKVERGRRTLASALPLEAEEREQRLLALLSDRDPHADEAIAMGGAPLAFERALAAPFIHAPERDYGTRCSTLLTIAHDGDVRFVECTWDRSGQPAGSARYAFSLDGSSPG